MILEQEATLDWNINSRDRFELDSFKGGRINNFNNNPEKNIDFSLYFTVIIFNVKLSSCTVINLFM